MPSPVGGGHLTQPPEPEVESTSHALTSSDIDRILGFESTTPTDWAVIESGRGILSVSTSQSQGFRALTVAARGFVRIQSEALSSLGARVGSAIHLDVWVPPEVDSIEPHWHGAVQLNFSIPSLAVNNDYLGQSELSPLPVGQWSTLTFTPTAQQLGKLSGSYSDLRFTIAINSSGTDATPYLNYRVDNLRVSDNTQALVMVVDKDGHAIPGATVVAYDGSSATSNTAVSDSAGLARVSVPVGHYRFGVDEDGSTYFSATTNHCHVPGLCPAATIVVKCYGVSCTAKDTCHSAGTCDPTSGVCSDPSKPDGTACDDENACTQTDTCLEGSCQGGSPVICPEPDQCHDPGVCEPGTGVCTNPPKIGGICDLTPIAEGIATLDNVTYAIFGYTNVGAENVHVSSGAGNSLTTPDGVIADPDPTLPTWFLTGTRHGALVYPLSGSWLKWTLGPRSVQVDATSEPLPVATREQGEGVDIGGTFVILKRKPGYPLKNAIVPTDYQVQPTNGDKIAQVPLEESVDVTGDGAAMVSIPIWVPPGKIRPSLSLNYHSRGGDDPVGFGWSLGGLSQITRCGKNLARDEQVAPVAFDHTDSYCLDGDLLVLKSGNGGDGSVYATEHDRFSKIVKRQQGRPISDPIGPDSFDVYLKDGQIMTYGGSAPSAIFAGFRTKEVFSEQDSAPPETTIVDFDLRYSWALQKVRDRYGNEMTFEYNNLIGQGSNHCNEQYVTKISYAGEKNRTVTFVYANNSDRGAGTSTQFVSGFCIQQSRYLTRIELAGPRPEVDATNKPVLLRQYKLYHKVGTTPGRLLLAGVEECDSANVCKPYTSLEYSKPTPDSPLYTVIQKSNIAPHLGAPANPTDPEPVVVAADLNGDGLDDIVYLDPTTPSRLAYQLSTGNVSDFKGPPLFEDPRQIPIDVDASLWARARAVDFNMDGLTDLVFPGSGPRATGASVWLTSRKQNGGVTFNAINIDTESPLPNNVYQGPPILADLDGDGLPEIARWYVDRRTTPSAPTLISYQKYDLAAGTLGPVHLAGSMRAGPQLRAGSFFGNGATQVLGGCESYSTCRLAAFDGSGAPVVTGIPVPPNWGSSSASVITLDANGDGLTDIMFPAQNFSDNSQNPDLYLNTGNGFRAIWWDNQNLQALRRNQIATRFAPFDLYKDGNEGLLLLGRRAVAGAPASPGLLLLGDGSGKFNSSVQLTAQQPGESSPQPVLPFAVLDATGSGTGDLLGLVGSSGLPVALVRNWDPSDVLTAIHSGARKTTISWIPLRDATLSEAVCAYPTYCVRRGPWVVSTLSRDTLYTDMYRYIGFKSDLRGRGMLGVTERKVRRYSQSQSPTEGFQFESSTEYDNDVIVKGGADIQHTYDYPFKELPKTSITTYYDINRTAGQTSRFSRSNTYEISVGSIGLGKSHWVGLKSFSETEVDNVGGGAPDVLKLSRYTGGTGLTYDSHGNPTYSEVLTRLSDGTTLLKETTITSYMNDESRWLISQPKSHYISSAAPDPDKPARSVAHYRLWSYTPDATTGFLRHTQYSGDTANERLDTEYEPNSSGFHKKVTQTVLGGHGPRVSKIEYDDLDGTFPKSVTTAVGGVDRTTRTTYHPGFGLLVDAEDLNGNHIGFTYDGFGRIRSESRTDGSGYSVHYWPVPFASPPPGPSLNVDGHVRYVSTNGGGETRVTYDRFGRETLRQTLDFTGAGYNAIRSSYLDDNNPLRPSRVTVPAANPDDPATPATIFVYDSRGKVVSRTLPDGATYTSTALGPTTETTGPGGRKSRIVDDGLGKPLVAQRFLDDGSASGKWTTMSFKYGPFGLLAQTIDPKNNVTRIDHDMSGRRVSLDDPDKGLSVFSYNGFGDLVAETHPPSGTGSAREQILYDYDDLGRLKKKSANNEGDYVYRWDTASNGMGKLGGVSSPDGIDLAYSYDSLGRMSTQTWTLQTGHDTVDGEYTFTLDYDSFGRVRKATYPAANGQSPVVAIQDYSSNGQLRSILKDEDGDTWWKVDARDAMGWVKQETAGKSPQNVVTTHDYAVSNGLLRQVKSTGPDGSVLRDLVYDYDGAWNLRQRTVDGEAELFGHDTLDRLVTWERGSGTVNEGTVFSYDELGNMVARQEAQFTNHIPTPVGSPTTFVPGDGTIKDPGGRVVGPHQIATSSLGLYHYDLAGHQDGAPANRTVRYSSFGLPRTIESPGRMTRFSYDGMARRVLKVSNDELVVSLAGLFERRRVGENTTDVFYIQGEGRPIAQVTRTTTNGVVQDAVQYLHEDHLKSVEAITNEAGQVVARQKFDPFGQRIGAAPPGVQLGFAGLKHDDDLGLVDMNGRIYDPSQARFLTPDPIIGGPLNAQNLNRYAYVLNSPLRWRDPSGFAGQCPGPDCNTTVVTDDGSARREAEARAQAEGQARAQQAAQEAAQRGAAQEAAAANAAAARGQQAAYRPGYADDGGSRAPGFRAPRSGWRLLDPQRLGFSFGSPFGSARLSEEAKDILQPLVDDLADSMGLPRIDLDEVDVLIGTPDGVSRDLPTGINIKTPGEASNSYEKTLGSIAHELGHKVQEGGFANFNAFNSENNQQIQQYGREAVYYTPGTLECQAQTFQNHVLRQQGF